MTDKTTKQQAGQRGGLSTLALYGIAHYQKIGKRGASVTWSRYSLAPINQSQYAMVDRQTGIIKAIR